MIHKGDKTSGKAGNQSQNMKGGRGADIRPALFISLVFMAGASWGQASAPAGAASGAIQAASAPTAFIAGLQPDRRPQGAPVKAERPLDDKQIERRMHGVSKPWPGNVEQIARTGDWWVPLRHAGMTAPYDIRGWHQPSRVIKQ